MSARPRFPVKLTPVRQRRTLEYLKKLPGHTKESLDKILLLGSVGGAMAIQERKDIILYKRMLDPLTGIEKILVQNKEILDLIRSYTGPSGTVLTALLGYSLYHLLSRIVGAIIKKKFGKEVNFEKYDKWLGTISASVPPLLEAISMPSEVNVTGSRNMYDILGKVVNAVGDNLEKLLYSTFEKVDPYIGKILGASSKFLYTIIGNIKSLALLNPAYALLGFLATDLSLVSLGYLVHKDIKEALKKYSITYKVIYRPLEILYKALRKVYEKIR